MADKWQANPVLTGSATTNLQSIIDTLKEIQKFNQSYITLLRKSFEAAKILQFDAVSLLLNSINGLILDIENLLQAYEEMGYYFINIDPYTIAQDVNNPNYGSYRVVDTELVPAYRADNGELKRIRDAKPTGGGLFIGTDADGNQVEQEFLNLGLTRVGLTVSSPVSEKVSTPNTGWDGTAKMSPFQVKEELVKAFDDEYDPERPNFPANAKMSGIVVIAAQGVPSDFPNLLDTITAFFEIESLKDLAKELKQLYTEPEETEVVLKYVCNSRYDETLQKTIDNEDGAIQGRFEVGDYIRSKDAIPAKVGKITKIIDTKDMEIRKEPATGKYPVEMTNTFLDNIVSSVQNQTGSQASSLIVQNALNNTTQLTSNILKGFITPTSTSGVPETINSNPKRYSEQHIRYVPLTKNWRFTKGEVVGKAEWKNNNPSSVVVKDSSGNIKEITNREASELPDNTNERLPADYVIQKQKSVDGAILGEVSKQNDIERVSYAPDFKRIAIKDIVPVYATVIQQIRSYIETFKESIKPSSAALDRIITYLDTKFKQIEDFYKELDKFTQVLINAAEALKETGLYVLYLDPQVGGTEHLKNRIDDSQGLPENTPYGLGFALFAGGPDNDILDPNASIINLANFLGLSSEQVSAAITQDADQEAKDNIIVRGTKDPESGGLIIESNARIYYELTGKIPTGWQYNTLLDDFSRVGEEQTFEEKTNALNTYEEIVLEIRDQTIEDLRNQLAVIPLTTEDSVGRSISLPQTNTLFEELTSQLEQAEEDSQTILDNISIRRKQLISNVSNALSSTGNTIILTTGSWTDFNIDEGSVITITNTSSSQSAGDVRTVSFVTNTSTLSIDTAFTQDLDQEENWSFRIPDPDISNTITSKTVRLGVAQNFQGPNGELRTNTDGVDKMTFLTDVMSNFPSSLPSPHALTGNTQLIILNAKRGGFNSQHQTEDFNWEKLGIQLGDEITVQNQTVKVVYIPYESYIPVDTDGTGVYNTFPETASISSGGNGKGDKNSVVVIPWPPKQGSNTYFAVNDDIIEMSANTILPRIKAFDPEIAAESNYTIRKFLDIEREKEQALAFERQQSLEAKDDSTLKDFEPIQQDYLELSAQLALIKSNVV